MLWILLGEALGATKPWSSYAAGVAATAISMPITYKSAQGLAGRSNKLVPGLMPSVLIGIAVPATAAWSSTHWVTKNQSLAPHSPWKDWGTMVGLNTMIWASGAALGMDSNKTEHALVYGLITSLIVPLPCLKNTSSVAFSPIQSQASSTSFTVQGTYYGSF